MFGRQTPSSTDRPYVDVVGPNHSDASSFDAFDHWLSDYAAVRDRGEQQRSLSEWPPTSSYAWNSYLSWALDQGTRFGPLPWTLPKRTRTTPRFRAEYGWDRNSNFGWIIGRDPINPFQPRRTSSSFAYALTTDRRVVRCTTDGFIHSVSSDQVEPDADDAPVVCASLLRAIGRWRLPFEGGHQGPEPAIETSGEIHWRDLQADSNG
jgi:hypothetical protein